MLHVLMLLAFGCTALTDFRALPTVGIGPSLHGLDAAVAHHRTFGAHFSTFFHAAHLAARVRTASTLG